MDVVGFFGFYHFAQLKISSSVMSHQGFVGMASRIWPGPGDLITLIQGFVDLITLIQGFVLEPVLQTIQSKTDLLIHSL